MPNTYNTVGQYLNELETTKSNIKRALEDKGATVTGGLSSYADAISNLPTGAPSKPKIYNGFKFIGGDIAKIDFSQYDWKMVYDTSEFFSYCSHSTGDWSNFESGFNGEIWSGVQMFYNCQTLTSIPQLDTSKVTNMDNMFRFCYKLTSIPQLDTSNVTNMGYMFGGCSVLTSIPQLDTSNVTNMGYMFQSCSVLTSIPQLDTSNVTNMAGMFSYCSVLTSIPQLDTSNVMDMNNMFYQCTSLTSIPQLDTSNVTNMSNMFGVCRKLTSIPQLDTSNVTNMREMFTNCSSLTSIPQLDISNVTTMRGIFQNCEALESLRFKGDPSKITDVNFIISYSARNGGTLYYDDRYDYSKIINVISSDSTTGDWTFIPYNVEEYEAGL